MAAPLFTRDASALRLLARPRWQRRVLAWTVPVAATVLAGLHGGTVNTAACSPRMPCGPDPMGSAFVGLLAAAALAGFIFPRLAGWFAAAFLGVMVASERLIGAVYVSPAWLYLVDLGFVGLCVMLGRVSRDRPPNAAASQFLAGTRRERLPAVAHLPRPGQGWRLAGWVLVVPVVACLGWGWYLQDHLDAQQRDARRVTAEVIAHPDDYTIEARFGGETVTIGVLESVIYPVGGTIELYVNDQGLRQPVSEPYDATEWYFLAVVLAGLAATLWARGVEQGHGLRGLFAEAQPVTEVSVLPGVGIIAVYAGDARLGEPAIFEIRTRTAVARADGDDEMRILGPAPDGPRPASLYGVPAPGHWCVAVVDGNPVLPWRPLSTQRVTAPPYGYVIVNRAALDDDTVDDGTAADDTVDDGTVSDGTVSDGTVSDGTVSDGTVSDGTANDGTAHAGPAPAPWHDLPLRAEEVETLRPVDREARPDQVRFHVRSPAVGYVSAAAMPHAVIALGWILPGLTYELALLIAGAALAISCVLNWRVLMRGRIAWNGRGVAVIGILGERRVGWPSVRAIEHDHDSVTIRTERGAVMVSAGPLLGFIGRRDRSAAELANALRHARITALTGGGTAYGTAHVTAYDTARGTAPGTASDTVAGPPAGGDVADGMPHLDRPRAPLGLWVLWLAGTPLLAWFLQLYADR